MRKGFLLAALGLVWSLGWSFGAVAADKEYINGIDANFPPFAYVDKSGQPTGFDVDALNWIAKEYGFKVKHQPMEWSGIVLSLKAGKIDCIASGLSVTKERAEQIAFTKPYWIIKQVVVVGKDSKLTLDEALGGGHKVGVQSGTSDAKAMEEMNKKDGRNYQLVMYDSSALAAEDVVNGRIEAAVMNDAPAADAASKKPLKILGPAGIPDEEFAIGVNKDNPEFLKTLNEGLDKLMVSPYWKELVAKYKPGEVH